MLSKYLVAAPLKKGQKIIYEGDPAEVIRISPLLVIKTKKRIVCGAIKIDHMNSKSNIKNILKKTLIKGRDDEKQRYGHI